MDIQVVRKSVKNARLQVLPDGNLRVVAPPDIDVDTFIEEHVDWINKRKKEIDGLAEEAKGKGNLLLLNGKFYHLTKDKEFEIQEGEPEGVVKYYSLRSLKRQLNLRLREELKETTAFYCRLMGLNYGRIFLRTQTTKWACCSSKHNLSFNLAMFALPENLREYIIIHELVHLHEPNHSKAFWEMVGFYYPDYREAEQELKKYWVMVERNKIWKKLRNIRL